MAGGAPVMMATLLGLVKEGMTVWTWPWTPRSMIAAEIGHLSGSFVEVGLGAAVETDADDGFARAGDSPGH